MKSTLRGALQSSRPFHPSSREEKLQWTVPPNYLNLRAPCRRYQKVMKGVRRVLKSLGGSEPTAMLDHSTVPDAEGRIILFVMALRVTPREVLYIRGLELCSFGENNGTISVQAVPACLWRVQTTHQDTPPSPNSTRRFTPPRLDFNKWRLAWKQDSLSRLMKINDFQL